MYVPRIHLISNLTVRAAFFFLFLGLISVRKWNLPKVAITNAAEKLEILLGYPVGNLRAGG